MAVLLKGKQKVRYILRNKILIVKILGRYRLRAYTQGLDSPGWRERSFEKELARWRLFYASTAASQHGGERFLRDVDKKQGGEREGAAPSREPTGTMVWHIALSSTRRCSSLTRAPSHVVYLSRPVTLDLPLLSPEIIVDRRIQWNHAARYPPGWEIWTFSWNVGATRRSYSNVTPRQPDSYRSAKVFLWKHPTVFQRRCALPTLQSSDIVAVVFLIVVVLVLVFDVFDIVVAGIAIVAGFLFLPSTSFLGDIFIMFVVFLLVSSGYSYFHSLFCHRSLPKENSS